MVTFFESDYLQEIEKLKAQNLKLITKIRKLEELIFEIKDKIEDLKIDIDSEINKAVSTEGK